MEAMNHESYVSLEVAKLLKEASFDWECVKNYIGESHSHILWTATTPGNLNDDSEVHKGWKSAPTLDVAQRWLREVKGIAVNVTTLLVPDISYKWQVRCVDTIHKDVWYTNIFETYEEAQEAGIKKALEIILKKGE